MGILADYMQIRARLDSAVSEALQGTMAENLRNFIVQSAYMNVYSYPAQMADLRRYEAGGLIADENLPASVSGTTLTIKNIAGLQDPSDGSPLAPIVESGNRAYRQPYPRPFMDEGRDEYVDGGYADIDLAEALRAAGFTVL